MDNDSHNNHYERSGFNSGMLIGLVAGAALGYYFTTDKGKKVLQQLTDEAGELFEGLQENEAVQTKLKQATEVVDEAKKAIKEKASSPKSKPSRPKFFRKSGDPLK